jgi:4'-phosphopantetheinyl transferase
VSHGPHPPIGAARPIAGPEPDVCLWLVDLDRAPAGPDERALLTADERARAARFHFDVHRHRFVACRAVLRQRLAATLGLEPRDVRFEYGPFGKPVLAGASRVRFNLSHSDQWALLALSADRDLGVDIERVRVLDDLDRLAETVFSPAERRDLARVDDSARAEAFFNGWTRKEAYIKARGDGLQRLTDFDVTLVPHEPVELRRMDGEPDEPARWSLSALTPVAGFAAALCVERAEWRRQAA